MAECCNANCVQWLKCTPVCSCVMQCTVFCTIILQDIATLQCSASACNAMHCTIILQGIAKLQCSVSALSTEEFSHYAALTHCVGRGPFLLCDGDDDDGDYDADDLQCCESSSSSCNCDWWCLSSNIQGTNPSFDYLGFAIFHTYLLSTT